MANSLMPIFLKLENQNCLVVGGGNVAYQKIIQLMDAKAKVFILSKDISLKTKSLLKNKSIKWIEENFHPKFLNGKRLVIGATSSSRVNKEIYEHSIKLNIPVNIVDQPDLCSFYFGAVHTDGDLKIAISTNGKSPLLAGKIRDYLNEVIPKSFAGTIEKFGEVRKQIQNKINTYTERKIFFEKLANIHFNFQKLAKVTLVGAGPGDPDLISVKGMKAIMEADVILHDALVSPFLVNGLNPNAKKINLGKRCGKHKFSQKKINELLLMEFQKNQKVVRLKGGDPFIFGRGGEEIDYLSKHNVKLDIVPGITAGIGTTSNLGISLTHRKYSDGVIFLTGHHCINNKKYDWNNIVKMNLSLVIYMGIKNIRNIILNLKKSGIKLNTPLAIIENGTTTKERIIYSDLNNIESKLKNEEVKTPALIVIGEVLKNIANVKNFVHNNHIFYSNENNDMEPYVYN